MQTNGIGNDPRNELKVVLCSANRLKAEESQTQAMTREESVEVASREVVDVTMRLPVVSRPPGPIELPYVSDIRHNDNEEATFAQGRHCCGYEAIRIDHVLQHVVENYRIDGSYRIGTVEQAMPDFEAMRPTKRRSIGAGLQPDISVPIVASKNLRQAAPAGPDLYDTVSPIRRQVSFPMMIAHPLDLAMSGPFRHFGGRCLGWMKCLALRIQDIDEATPDAADELESGCTLPDR